MLPISANAAFFQRSYSLNYTILRNNRSNFKSHLSCLKKREEQGRETSFSIIINIK